MYIHTYPVVTFMWVFRMRVGNRRSRRTASSSFVLFGEGYMRMHVYCVVTFMWVFRMRVGKIEREEDIELEGQGRVTRAGWMVEVVMMTSGDDGALTVRVW
jgi:hypothetical protein